MDQLIVQGTGEAGVPELSSVEAIWADTEQSSMLSRDLIIKPGGAENLKSAVLYAIGISISFSFLHVRLMRYLIKLSISLGNP